MINRTPSDIGPSGSSGHSSPRRMVGVTPMASVRRLIASWLRCIEPGAAKCSATTARMISLGLISAWAMAKGSSASQAVSESMMTRTRFSSGTWYS